MSGYIFSEWHLADKHHRLKSTITTDDGNISLKMHAQQRLHTREKNLNKIWLNNFHALLEKDTLTYITAGVLFCDSARLQLM